jgi:hypothetical protein
MKRFWGWNRSAWTLALVPWLMLAPAALADSIDAHYFDGLTAHGITASLLGGGFDLASAVKLGHVFCADLRNGVTPIQEGMQLLDSTNHKITQDQAFFWVGDAIGSYCSEQSANVHG